MKLLITILTMIFISFGASANSYDWSTYGTSKAATFYFNDINVYKTNYTIRSQCSGKYGTKCNFQKFVQSIRLKELLSFKETQTYNGNFRYRSHISDKEYDCKTYKYYLHSRSYFKEKIVNYDTTKPITSSVRFTDQDRNKFPQIKEGKILGDIVKKICKSFYPNGAKIFSQKLNNGKVIRREDVDSDCAILLKPTATASDKQKAQSRLIERGLIPFSGDDSYCYKVLEPTVEIK